MRLLLAALTLLLVTACGEPPVGSGGGNRWAKPGGTAADFQKDSFDCERETRAVAHTFAPGIFRDAEANSYAARCMTAKGYSYGYHGAPPMIDAAGKQYDTSDRVYCRFRSVQSVELPANTCTQGGGTILGPVK